MRTKALDRSPGTCKAGLERRKVSALQDADRHYSLFYIVSYLYQLRSGRLDISQFPLGRGTHGYEFQALHCEQRWVSSCAGAPPAEVKSGSCSTVHTCLLSVPSFLIQEDGFCLCAPKLRHKLSRGAFLFCLCLSHRQLSSKLDTLVELFRVQRIMSFSLSCVRASSLITFLLDG